MMRLPDWQTRYYTAVQPATSKEFKWGENDCVMFCARVYDAITGGGMYERLRAEYTWDSKESAGKLIAAAGGLQGLVEKVLGPAGRWVECSTGDVVLARTTDGVDVLTVHDGHCLLTTKDVGIQSMPLRLAVVGWRV